VTVEVKKPVVIIGTGRNGSSIFLRMFTYHPEAAWLSTLCNWYPDKPVLNRLFLKAIDFPFIGAHLNRKNNPDEAYNLWDIHCKGFRRPFRDLTQKDVTEKSKKDVRRIMAYMLNEKRHRLLLKLTGWPRIGFLKEIFPDARFIHIVRDGRAVVNSLLQSDFWMGWHGPSNWRWGELPPNYLKEWNRHEESFIAMAAIQWKIILDATESAISKISPKDIIEIKYEEICTNIWKTFETILAFCEMECSRAFEKSLGRFKLRNANDKWKNDLTRDQQEILSEILDKHLSKCAYK